MNLTSDNEADLTEELERYLALRQRLTRATVGPVIGYLVGYQIILPLILSTFKALAGIDDDDDEPTQWAKLAVWIKEDPARKRWFSKGLLPAAFNYLDSQAYTLYGHTNPVSNPDDPDLTDFIDPAMAINAIRLNLQESAIARAIKRFDQEKTKEKGDLLLPAAELFTGVLNFGGVLKSYDLNKNAIKALQGLTTKLSHEQWENIKPDNYIEAVTFTTLNQGLYEKVTGNVAGQIADINTKVIEDYNRTGNDDFLPPKIKYSVVRTEDNVKKEAVFTQGLKDEFRQMIIDERNIRVDALVSPRDWKEYSDDKKIEKLRKEYAKGREVAADKFFDKYKDNKVIFVPVEED